MFTIGVAVLSSALTVFYRDVGNVATHVLRLWFYLSPALYSADQVTKFAGDQTWVATVFGLNPFSVLFQAYQAVIYHGSQPAWGALGLLLVGSLGLLVACMYVFQRVERAFAKVL